MICADTIIEPSGLFLRNMHDKAEELDKWYSGSSYGFISTNYTTQLAIGHYYYRRYTYKFTTTNQSPTWVEYYLQTGSVGGPRINNPVAEIEYTASQVQQINPIYTQAYGTIYQGNSSAISGVTGYVKNIICYDVTDLRTALMAQNATMTEENFKTWCDTNLQWTPSNEPLSIANLLGQQKEISIKKGAIVAEQFIESDGMRFYASNSNLKDTAHNRTWFDDGVSGVIIYNNTSGGAVTHTIIDSSTVDSPWSQIHPKCLKIITNGTASPGAGGFCAQHIATANKVFIETFIAKVPVGYTVTSAYNSQGTGSSVTYLSARAGTGNWEEYKILYKCGSSGTFSSGGYVYISGSDNKNVTWYVAYANNCEITDHEDWKTYSVLNGKNTINKGIISTDVFDCASLIPNGKCQSQQMTGLGNKWYYDDTDYAGDAKCSVVQPVGGGSGFFSSKFAIDPTMRYKVSYWVKCKADMTSFLTAIVFSDANGNEYSHTNFAYVSGTRTQVTKAVAIGDTEIEVKSNANWVQKSYSKIGVRANSTADRNSNTSSAANIVTGTTGTNIINLAQGINIAIPVNSYIVESYDGGTYPYPIQKTALPTDNTWKLVTGYFGTENAATDGANNNWSKCPYNARYARVYLNIYSNTGSVPIKYSDIRVEPVGTKSNRLEQKVQIIKGV